MTKPKNLEEYQQGMAKFAIQVLSTINKDGFMPGNHFFHERSGIEFKGIEVDQNLKLNELFIADNKRTMQIQQIEPQLENWKINTEKLVSILSVLPSEIATDVNEQFPKRKRKIKR